MKTKLAITPKESGLLLRNLIIWLIGTAGFASFVIYSLSRIVIGKVVNDEVWMYVFAFSVVVIMLSITTVKLLLDFSSKEIDEGQSEITDVGREIASTFSRYIRVIASTFSRYIRLSSLGKKKIQIQYADRDKMSIGDTIKFRIAPKSRMLLSYEVGVTAENKEVLFPATEVNSGQILPLLLSVSA